MATIMNPKSQELGKRLGGIVLACLLGIGLSMAQADEPARSPVSVKIRDDRASVVEAGVTGPVDPVPRIRFMPQPQLNVNVTTEQGQMLHLSHTPGFNIDGQFTSPFNGGLAAKLFG